MKNTEALREPVSQLIRQGKSIDEVLMFLREQGCSKIDSMWLLEDVAGMTDCEAKKAVHFSAAWNDVRDRDEQFQEELIKETKKLGHERRDGPIEM